MNHSQSTQYLTRQESAFNNSSIILIWLMELQQQPTQAETQFKTSILKTVEYPSNLQPKYFSNRYHQHPILTKIRVYGNSFYAAYSDGKIVQHQLTKQQGNLEGLQPNGREGLPELKDRFKYQGDFWNTCGKIQNVLVPFHNTDVIDFSVMRDGNILCCSHTEVSLYNSVKGYSMSLHGHEETITAVCAHPFSPMAVSVSNLIIHHDLRTSKPININLITPPINSLEYFADGQSYLLSGQPCRILRNGYMRTLLSGISTISHNGNLVLCNQMDSKISLMNWRKSQKWVQLTDVKNRENYQPIHYIYEDGDIKGFLFLEDNGQLLHYDLLKRKTTRQLILDSEACGVENWKMQVSHEPTTSHIILYEHESAQIKCYSYQNQCQLSS